MFSWIGSDGWSARNLVSDGNEPEVLLTPLIEKKIKKENLFRWRELFQFNLKPI
jgi:hypothetical protein